MKSKWLLWGSALMIAAALAVWSAPAQATVFTFSDEYLATTLAEFTAAFGSTATGYTTAGVYERINTTSNAVVQMGASIGSPVGLSVPLTGEFVPDASGPYTGLVLTNFKSYGAFHSASTPFAIGSGPNPPTYPTGYTYVLQNGTTTSFQYKTGITQTNMSDGVVTPFNANSISLGNSNANGSTGFTIQGYLGGSLVPGDVVTGSINNTNDNFHLLNVTLNFADVDQVFVSFASLDPLYIGNINITPLSPVPVPPSVLLLGSGILGMGLLGFRRRKFTA